MSAINFLGECEISSYLSSYLTQLLKIKKKGHIPRRVFGYMWDNTKPRSDAFLLIFFFVLLIFFCHCFEHLLPPAVDVGRHDLQSFYLAANRRRAPKVSTVMSPDLSVQLGSGHILSPVLSSGIFFHTNIPFIIGFPRVIRLFECWPHNLISFIWLSVIWSWGIWSTHLGFCSIFRSFIACTQLTLIS